MTERRPPDDPVDEPEDDENPEFDRFEETMKKLLEAKPSTATPIDWTCPACGVVVQHDPSDDWEPELLNMTTGMTVVMRVNGEERHRCEP